MNRIIEVKVNGDYLVKDSDQAGTQFEANVNSLRITFDESWDGFIKKVLFWDAAGKNPVRRILTAEMLENAEKDLRVYLCPIPGEPMAVAGKCEFVIEGYVDGKRQRTVADTLKVKASPRSETETEPADPTPSQAEQLQMQINALMTVITKVPYIGDNGHWYVWNAESMAFVDSGVPAQGEPGEKGDPGKPGEDGKPGAGVDNITAEQIGAMPYRGFAADLNAILKDSKPGYYSFEGITTHTPHSEGATGAQAGIVLNIPDNGYGYTQQIAFFKGSMTPLFRHTNGDINAISKWSSPYLRHDGGDIFGNVSLRGFMNVICNAGGLSLIGDDHVFVQIHKNGVGSQRSGYFGYGSAYSGDLTLCNEIEGGALKLEAKGGVYVGGARVPRVYQSTAAPTAADGVDGDVWHQYV